LLAAGPATGRVAVSEAQKAGSALTLSQRAGLRYEAKVQRLLAERWPASYRPAIWIEFRASPLPAEGRTACISSFTSPWRLCQPDGLLDADDTIVVLELKAQHTQNAWWQLRKLYQPVVQALYPSRSVRVCEVCQSYLPGAFPEDVRLLSSLDDLAALDADDFYVLPLRL